MKRDGGTLRSRFLGSDRPTDERLSEALESLLDDTESVEYRFTSTDGIVHEHQGETTEKGTSGDGTLLAVTDRRLVFVVDTESNLETAEVPYTDLKKIETDGGLLGAELVVRIWGRGTLRFQPQGSDSLEEVAGFVSVASDTWERAVAALQDARQHIAELPTHLADGDLDAAEEAREAAHDHIETARERSDGATAPVESAIRERTREVERELARTRMEGRFKRGRNLSRAVSDRVDAGDYNGAYDRFRRACTNVDVALSLAREWDFGVADRIESEREALEDQLEWLEAQPLERAEAALARARRAENPHAAVRAWEHALACYRDALTAGWGTDASFDGDTDALRLQVEWLAGRVIRLRCQLADQYEAEGKSYQARGYEELGLDRYETACAHLVAAHRLAKQYLAGDVSDINQRFYWIEIKTGAF